ncbi:hypothetical protein M427DRAFT_68641 [Gonapodya prolifera JEL478]|uniref:Ion transport domain-containing protein n=1 Tax=Gonapodya prolifera (strain JEL478) TaxID=1344416 RepID=A0A139AKD8_GONPJ|nr:hypothetical protein M427DRAFT_68641 [Gonapodya prolifera JEL478]|eukprot:KXS17239.1 hypothetical protein M427DRAFT_68641 [Gonapodya prolifera JEL478]
MAESTGARMRRSKYKATVDVELTYPAFQMPAVSDPRIPPSYESLFPPSPLPTTPVDGSDNGYPVDSSKASPGAKPKRVFFSLPEGIKPWTPPTKSSAEGTRSGEGAASDGSDDDEQEMNGENNFYVPDTVDDGDNTDSYNNVRKLIFSQAIRQNINRLEARHVNFSDVVDVDDAFDTHVREELAAELADSDYFRLVIFVIILANSVLIALQTDPELTTKYGHIFQIVDQLFIGIFIMEILFKWYVDFWGFWSSGWHWFDFVLVGASLAGGTLAFASNGRILRILRVLRALRSLRSLAFLQGLQMIVQTVVDSLLDMVNIVLLLLIVMFIFAVLGTTLFADHDSQHWGDLGATMFTLFILITQDSWVDIFDTLEAKGQFSVAAAYFGAFIIIGAFVFQNLIVAVVVTNLESSYDEAKKAEKAKHRQLRSESAIAAQKQAEGGDKAKPDVAAKRKLRQVVPPPDGNDPVWKSQIPYEIPDFDKLSKSKLDNYFLVLTVLEENMREYLELKEQLQEVLMELKLINGPLAVPADAEEDGLDDGDDGSDSEDGGDDGGDALSQWMRTSSTKKSAAKGSRTELAEVLRGSKDLRRSRDLI